MKSYRLYIYSIIAILLPATRFFWLKRVLLRWAGATVGRNVRICSSARFMLSGPLEIGDNTWIGHEVLVTGGAAAVRIGSDVDIAPRVTLVTPRVTLVTGTHVLFEGPGKAAGRGYSEPIVIGNGAWIGAASTILGGVRVGAESVVASGALVCADVAQRTVVGGIPARVLREEGQPC